MHRKQSQGTPNLLVLWMSVWARKTLFLTMKWLFYPEHVRWSTLRPHQIASTINETCTFFEETNASNFYCREGDTKCKHRQFCFRTGLLQRYCNIFRATQLVPDCQHRQGINSVALETEDWCERESCSEMKWNHGKNVLSQKELPFLSDNGGSVFCECLVPDSPFYVTCCSCFYACAQLVRSMFCLSETTWPFHERTAENGQIQKLLWSSCWSATTKTLNHAMQTVSMQGCNLFSRRHGSWDRIVQPTECNGTFTAWTKVKTVNMTISYRWHHHEPKSDDQIARESKYAFAMTFWTRGHLIPRWCNVWSFVLKVSTSPNVAKKKRSFAWKARS